jgi:diguanylate cyclase (GGDEF)-like protein
VVSPGAAEVPISGFVASVRRALSILPHGRVLTTEDWTRRHNAIVVILLLHVVGLLIFGVSQGRPLQHVLVDVGGVSVFAVLAAQPWGGRKLRASMASLGLLTASAMLVHLSGGAIEAHFHYFVVIAILMLYQDWLPFLVAIAYVVMQHGVIGTMFPSAVYDHASARQDPWLWAAIHGVFVLAASAANLAYWRLSEDEHERNTKALHLAARVDGLTSAVNRRGWEELLPRTLAAARRIGFDVCVALVDFDSFKAFNDSWGHQKGDLLLMRSVESWRSALREEDILARYGGDEFAVILTGCDLEGAKEVLQRLLALTPEGQTCSVGLGGWNGSETAAELVARVDSALYEGKRSKKVAPNGIHIAADEGGEKTDVPWAKRIPQLLARREIESVYQPIMRMADLHLYGYEALARPLGGAAGMAVDGMFEAAGRLGYLRDLDWISRRAALEGGDQPSRDFPLFVNVSLSALLDPVHDVDQMMMLAWWSGRQPEDIILELTEREEARDFERLQLVVHEYREHGFRFAVDDVGEGHSTLELLVAISPEFIKIARSLTANTGSTAAQAAIQAVVTLASAQGGQVIAEGIETQEVLQSMRALGVHLGQGFLLGRPARMTPSRVTGQLFAQRAVEGGFAEAVPS